MPNTALVDALQDPIGDAPSLIEADLSGADLSGANLSGRDLSRSNLSDANLTGANLKGATLFGCQLDGAEFAGADLTGANLSEVHGDRVGFGAANLANTVFNRAGLTNASFTQSRLHGSDLRGARFRNARFYKADLTDVVSVRADFRDATLEESLVAGACFDHADLRGVDLDGMRGYETASWIGVDTRDVNFSGAYLLRRHILDENYILEFRRQSRLHALLYRAWWITSDCGRSLLRWSACTVLVAVSFAIAYQFVSIDYGDYPTSISPFYFSVVTLTTLGYGDVTPMSVGAQVLSMCEVVLGYIALGGLLSILSNKMARRAD